MEPQWKFYMTLSALFSSAESENTPSAQQGIVYPSRHEWSYVISSQFIKTPPHQIALCYFTDSGASRMQQKKLILTSCWIHNNTGISGKQAENVRAWSRLQYSVWVHCPVDNENNPVIYLFHWCCTVQYHKYHIGVSIEVLIREFIVSCSPWSPFCSILSEINSNFLWHWYVWEWSISALSGVSRGWYRY